MDTAEQRAFADTVVLVNRIDKPLEFLWDSRLYVIPAGGKQMMPRMIAEKGVEKHPVKVDSMTGDALESLMGIEGDPLHPCTPLEVNLKEVKESHKLDAPVIPGAEGVGMKTQDLKPHAESFVSHNT